MKKLLTLIYQGMTGIASILIGFAYLASNDIRFIPVLLLTLGAFSIASYAIIKKIV